MPSAVSDPAPGSLRHASSARPVPARSRAGGRAGAAHPLLGRPFPAHPICRAVRALRRIPRGDWAEKQPEFLAGNGDRRGNTLTWSLFASFSTQARPTYFLGVAQEKAFTPGVRKRSQSRPAPRPAIPSRAPPALASVFFFPCYFPLPFVLFLPSRRSRLLPPRSDATGQQRVVVLGAQSSPRLSRASLLLSPGTSLSLGCAKRPLVVRFAGRASRAPGKSSPLKG